MRGTLLSFAFGIWRAAYASARFLRLLLWWSCRWTFRRRPSATELGARFRTELETLGVTYVKLGQFLAMRFDLLPVEVCSELSRLFDSVRAVAPRTIRRVLEDELGSPVEELYASFEWDCVAAASVAQVHRARLPDGSDVAVKVQRPHAREIFFADIRNLRLLATIIDRVLPIGAISLADGVAEFEAFTLREMDFEREAQTSELVRERAGGFESVPAVHWALTRRRVLTMEFEVGVPASRIIELREQGRFEELEALLPGIDLAASTRRLAQACFRQLFDDGFFHADPHPGNIFLRRDGTIVFLDFGIFGHLPAAEKATLSRFVESAALGDVAGTYHQFAKLLSPRERSELALMQRDMISVIYRWIAAVSDLSTPPAERHFGKYVNEFLNEARRHGTGMSLDSLLFWRALIAFNGTGLRLNPGLDVVEEIGRFFGQRSTATLGERLRKAYPSTTPSSLGRGQLLPRPAAARTLVAEHRLDARDRRIANANTSDGAKTLLAIVLASLAATLPWSLGAVCLAAASALAVPVLGSALREASPFASRRRQWNRGP